LLNKHPAEQKPTEIIEDEASPEKQSIASEDTSEEEEELTNQASQIYTETPPSVAADAASRRIPLYIQERSIVIDAPQRDQDFLALRWPLQIDFVFRENEGTEEKPELKRWSLIEIKDEKTLVPLKNFDMQSTTTQRGQTYQTELSINHMGRYGLIPSHQKIESAASLAVVFSVLNSEAFKARLKEQLQSVDKNSVKRLQVEP
jgi:hypothetical protein